MMKRTPRPLHGYLQDRRYFHDFFYLGFGLCGFGLIHILRIPFFFFHGNISLGISLVLGGLFALGCLTQVCRVPPNNPWQFLLQYKGDLKRRKAPVLVCLGDSLTHGTCSANWVNRILPELARKMKYSGAISKDATFQCPLYLVNAGQNSLTTTVVGKERVGPVLECQPDYILILIGTNDMLGTYSPLLLGGPLRRAFDLPPDEPSFQSFEKNIRENILEPIAIAERSENNLSGKQEKKKIKMAICTLPPLGEDLTHPANQLVKKANAKIRSIVSTLNEDRSRKGNPCTVIPLFETMEAILLDKQASGESTLHSYIDFGILSSFLAMPSRYIFGLKYTTLFRPFRHALLSDCIHFNENGATVLTNLVVKWLLDEKVEEASKLST